MGKRGDRARGNDRPGLVITEDDCRRASYSFDGLCRRCETATTSYPRVAMCWISAIASCARRLGRNPYEHGVTSTSKIGSPAPAFRAACITRPATVGTPNRRTVPPALDLHPPRRRRLDGAGPEPPADVSEGLLHPNRSPDVTYGHTVDPCRPGPLVPRRLLHRTEPPPPPVSARPEHRDSPARLRPSQSLSLLSTPPPFPT